MVKTNNETIVENKALYGSILSSLFIVVIMLVIGYIVESLKKDSKKEDNEVIYAKESAEFHLSIHS